MIFLPNYKNIYHNLSLYILTYDWLLSNKNSKEYFKDDFTIKIIKFLPIEIQDDVAIKLEIGLILQIGIILFNQTSNKRKEFQLKHFVK